MENNADKNEKIPVNEVSDPSVKRRKANKTLVMMGSVVLISVGCAFVFVSKVYPSLHGNVQLDAVHEEKKPGENGIEIQTAKPAEMEEVPKSASKKKGEKGKEENSDIEEESTIVPFDPVIVNLSGSGGRRYLKVLINLEAKDGKVKHKIEAKLVPIKDRLISILSSKTLEDIEGFEGQESLRREIKDAADMMLKMEDGILQVYFTEFVIQ
ncbi:MAG: hypothetical protein CV087_14735 [Candidatus Brocadia sp. WS118]|nr:MAG: hypothetical protein CV087_14735 [Candidatus Brocadia sp. WS118]